MSNFDNTKILLCKEEPFFLSPEGEGLWSGRLCSWMRTSTCNLSCAWANSDGTVTLCDTPYTSHKPSRHTTTVQEAYNTLTKYKTNNISISGGEPFQSEGTLILVDKLIEAGYQVKIETNGTIFKQTKATLISMSPKLQSSSSGLKLMAETSYNKQDTNNFLKTESFETQARVYARLYERHESQRYNLSTMKQFIDFYGNRVIFKFVANTESDINEIIEKYINPLNINNNQVWLMPQGISSEQLNEKSRWVIEKCKQFGWNYSDRIHIRVYGNKAGV